MLQGGFTALLKRKQRKIIVFVLIAFTLTIVFSFSIKPAQAASVAILSHSGYLSSIDSYWIFGEFQNLESVPITCKYVTATFYDSSNNQIAIQEWHTGFLEVIGPSQKSPFFVLLSNTSGNTALGPKVDHYSLEFTTLYTTSVPLDLRVLSSNTSVDIMDVMHFKGVVENAGSVTANYTQVFLTCYDSTGTVVYTDSTYASITALAPGEKTNFELQNIHGDITPKIANYSLVPESIITGTDLPSSPTPSSPTPSSGGSTPPPADVNAVWVPSHGNAAAATAVTIVAIGAVSMFAAALNNSAASAGRMTQKIQDAVPEGAKKWLEEFMSSKREAAVNQKIGSPFLLTKPEALAYAVSLVALTISFSYVKVTDLTQIWQVLPTVLATAVIIEVVKTYALEVVARRRGLWTEHRIWYFGLAMFLITTFTFGIPFSSPSRNIYHSPKLTKRLNGIVASAAVLVTLAFAAFFFALLISGFTLIGGTGLAICIIMGLIDTLPVQPMNGKAIYDYKKSVWAAFFLIMAIIYVSWLLFF